MTNMKLAVFGGGGHGKVVVDCARLMGQWTEIIIFDDQLGKNRSFQDLLRCSSHEFEVIIALGNNKVREELQSEVSKKGFALPLIRHPSSIVAEDVTIGKGSVLAAGAIINPGAQLGNGCIVNTAASVDHDCQVENFVHIAPGARLAGTVQVGQKSWIGLGAVIRENRTIGANVLVAAGAVVVDDVPDEETVIGVPARVKE